MTKNIKGIEYEDIILITKAFKVIKGFKTGFFKSLQKNKVQQILVYHYHNGILEHFEHLKKKPVSMRNHSTFLLQPTPDLVNC